MSDPVNVFTTNPAPVMGVGGYGGGFGGDGFGGGGLGALLAVALLGGRGFGGFGGFGGGVVDGGCKREACLDGTDGMAIMGAIGGVKDTVGMSTMNITTQLSEGFAAGTTNTLQLGIMLGNQAATNQAMTVAAIGNVNQNVSDQGCATRTAIMADGTATRLLITQLNTDNLNRLLTVADLDRRDECNRSRSREVEVNVTQNVNQQQVQLQQQQQQQAIVSTLGFLCNEIAQVKQVARATNENVIVGNTGAVATGPQTANPTNVNTK